MIRLSSVVARASRPCLLLLAVAVLLCPGCPAPDKLGSNFTIKSDGQLKAAAPLANAANAVAKKIDNEGATAKSEPTGFLVAATGVWAGQTGPSGSTIPATLDAVRAENAKILAAAVEAKKQAEAEKQAHVTQLKERDDAIDKMEAQLEKEREASRMTEMYAKLWAILLVGGAAITACFLCSFTQKLAPLVAIGFAGLASAVVVKAVAGDVIWVLIVAGVLAGVYIGIMWLLSARKASTAVAQATAATAVTSAVADAIEKLPAPIAPLVKRAVQVEAGNAGVQPALAQFLVDKGYSTAESEKPAATAAPAAAPQAVVTNPTISPGGQA